MNFLLKNFKIKIYFFSLLIILAVFTNVFYNFYAISKRPYDERLMWHYGFDCEKNSYGFVQKVFDKHLGQQSISIINFKNMPNVQFLFHNIKIDESKKNLFLLNFKNKNKDKEKLHDLKIYLNKYSLIENTDNCYFYKKND